jgi:predicted amidophosphoribosyltransferase
MLTAELVALVVPPRCAACRSAGRRAHDVLCGACRRALPWLEQPCCERCALALPHVRGCPARDAPFDAAWSAVAYEGVARDAMHALKFSAARPLADVMAAQIAANAPWELLPPPAQPAAAPRGARSNGPAAPRGARAHAFVEPAVPDVALVAVPAHPGRRRTRGFDPAELLARALARRTGLPLARTLRRSASAGRQLGASRDERRAAGGLGFAARGPAPRIAILVDDVHTTGATLSACAQALKQAGARRVIAITWARTL